MLCLQGAASSGNPPSFSPLPAWQTPTPPKAGLGPEHFQADEHRDVQQRGSAGEILDDQKADVSLVLSQHMGTHHPARAGMPPSPTGPLKYSAVDPQSYPSPTPVPWISCTGSPQWFPATTSAHLGPAWSQGLGDRAFRSRRQAKDKRFLLLYAFLMAPLRQATRLPAGKPR